MFCALFLFFSFPSFCFAFSFFFFLAFVFCFVPFFQFFFSFPFFSCSFLLFFSPFLLLSFIFYWLSLLPFSFSLFLFLLFFFIIIIIFFRLVLLMFCVFMSCGFSALSWLHFCGLFCRFFCVVYVFWYIHIYLLIFTWCRNMFVHGVMVRYWFCFALVFFLFSFFLAFFLPPSGFLSYLSFGLLMPLFACFYVSCIFCGFVLFWFVFCFCIRDASRIFILPARGVLLVLWCLLRFSEFPEWYFFLSLLCRCLWFFVEEWLYVIFLSARSLVGCDLEILPIRMWV